MGGGVIGPGRLSPRQKMINLMYLVLTALLALNVSKDILEAFVRVNNSLIQTNISFTAQNAKLYEEFEKQLAVNRAKVKPYYDATIIAKQYTQEIYDSITELKKRIIAVCDKHNPSVKEEKDMIEAKLANVALISAKDNYDEPTRIMVGGGNDPSVGDARKLKMKLEDYRNKLLELIKNPNLSVLNREKIIQDLGDLGLKTNDPKEEELSEDEKKDPASRWWETRNFYHNVSIATLTILTNLQNDVRNAEAKILNTLFSQISAADFKFDTLAGKIIPKSSYIIQGDKYEADIFVAAFSTTENPQIFVGDGYDSVKQELTGKVDSVPVQRGVGRYVIPAGGVGLRKFSALIKVKKPGVDGSQPDHWKYYPIKNVEYRVAPPMAVVSPTKMNVLYRGIDNPVSISAAGVSAEDIVASISNGTLASQGGGNFIARPGSGDKSSVSVSAKMGKTSRQMGQPFEFRVKDVPDPVPTLMIRDPGKPEQKLSGIIKLKQLGSANLDIVALLENFAFDLSFVITKFKLVMQTPGGDYVEYEATGNKFTAKQKEMMKVARANQRISFEGINAKGPDGKNRSLPNIGYKVVP
ncbi:MAG: gliding motility protein GldM [Bacteroidia bacterium]|nr:gliding motility protein GldM [Bacteroidia bacterium]